MADGVRPFDLAESGPGGAEPSDALLSEVLGVAEMDDEACLDVMVLAARSIAAWEAVMVRAQVQFAAQRPPTGHGEERFSEFAADEFAPLLGLSPGLARGRLWTAHALVTRLPGTLRALETGVIDYRRAAAMAEVTEPLDAGAGAGGGGRGAGPGGPGQPRGVPAGDPPGGDERRPGRGGGSAAAGQEERRRVEIRPLDDGMAELRLTLPAELAEAIYDRLTAVGAAGRLRAGPADAGAAAGRHRGGAAARRPTRRARAAAGGCRLRCT